MSRRSLSGALSEIPLCTQGVAILCVAIQVYVTLTDVPLNNFALSAAPVIYLGEYYRIVSAALLHGNLMHIAMNMMSFVAIGSGLETSVGTLAMMFIIGWSILLGGLLHVGIEWVMTMWITHDLSYVFQPAVGFSGVIFTLALMESYRSTQATRSLFGMINVPTKLYPWVLMIMISVMLPNISLVGHLSGILVGLLHVHGVTKPLLPSQAYLTEMEGQTFIRDRMSQRPSFVPSPTRAAAEATPSSTCTQSLGEACSSAWRSACSILSVRRVGSSHNDASEGIEAV